jgi:hypothetical protein
MTKARKNFSLIEEKGSLDSGKPIKPDQVFFVTINQSNDPRSISESNVLLIKRCAQFFYKVQVSLKHYIFIDLLLLHTLMYSYAS